MLRSLASKLSEALISVSPVAAIVVLINLTPLVNYSTSEIITFVISAFFMILGIGLFNLGADLAMTPMGDHVGQGLTKSGSLKILLSAAFLMGVLITVAEPDLSVLGNQVSSVMNKTLLIVTVGVGVGLFLVFAILKIVFRKSLSYLLMFFYLIAFSLVGFIVMSGRADLLPLSFDSGGVTTGPITVPFIMALGIGIASTIGGKNSGENSFGLVAMCSIGPILAVMTLTLFSKKGTAITLPDYSGSGSVAKTLLSTAEEVIIALGLIVVFFAILQIIYLKLPLRRLGKMAIGMVYTFAGLVIFLSSVSIGFMPVGYKMGTELAKNHPAIIAAFGFVLGAVTVLAEPAIHILNKQVEEVTDKTVSRRSMLTALSIGVGISVCLSLVRIIFDFSILYYLVPGYIISLGISLFVPGIYTAIAFDSGGVASGPLTSTFVLPFAVGVCTALHGEGSVMGLAFGIVATVAMTPLIAIQILGFRAIVAKKIRNRIAMKRILDAEDEQIINFM